MGALLSPFCRQTRHTACVAAGGNTTNCGCPCHYEEMPGVVEAPASTGSPARTEGDPLGAMRDLAQQERDRIEATRAARVGCTFPGCGRDFKSEQAKCVHFSRAHKVEELPEEPELPPEDEVLDEIEEAAPDVESVTIDNPSQLFLDVAAAYEFLEAKRWDDVVNEALDHWAATEMNDDSEIKALVTIRRARRDG